MACGSCGTVRTGPVPRTNTRRPVAAGSRETWVVVYRQGGQTVTREISGGPSDYLAACRLAGQHSGRVWPKQLWDQNTGGGAA